MSDLDGGSSDYLDDDLDDFVVRDDDSPRSAKRRRVSSRSERSRRRTDSDESNNESIGSQSDSYSDDDEHRRRSSRQSSFYSRDDPGEQKSKYKTFVSKQTSIRDNIFVTQLTQPPSPPEMIRGPRWKKPDPVPPPPPVADTADAEPQAEEPGRERDYGDDDEGLKAAIEASLQSFEEENTRDTSSAASKDLEPATAPNTAESADLFDDIPDDAFDSDLSLSPPTRQTPQVPWATSEARMRPLGVRQTTLFDIAARSPATQPPRGEQMISPPDKVEPPTQHKLNQDSLETWIYPTNLGKTRDYQFNITQKGLFHNLLVALPTGLGKTFIAATVMLNWLRWTRDTIICTGRLSWSCIPGCRHRSRPGRRIIIVYKVPLYKSPGDHIPNPNISVFIYSFQL